MIVNKLIVPTVVKNIVAAATTRSSAVASRSFGSLITINHRCDLGMCRFDVVDAAAAGDGTINRTMTTMSFVTSSEQQLQQHKPFSPKLSTTDNNNQQSAITTTPRISSTIVALMDYGTKTQRNGNDTDYTAAADRSWEAWNKSMRLKERWIVQGGTKEGSVPLESLCM